MVSSGKRILDSVKSKFIQSNGDDSNNGYILEVGVSYLKQLQKIHSDLLFLPERVEIYKCQKLVCKMYDKKNYVVPVKVVKLALY